MNEPGLDPELAELMLRGEPTGPRRLAELLTAASSESSLEDLKCENVAVAAFREARSFRSIPPRSRRSTASVSLKAVLITFLLTLAGGITAAAASHHLPGPLGDPHTPSTRTPATSRTFATRMTPHPPAHRIPARHDKHGEQPHEKAGDERHSHPPKKPEDHPEKTMPHKPKEPAHHPPGQ